MKTFFTFLFSTLYISVFSFNWMAFGPTEIHANNILFSAGSQGYSVICTDNGICVNNGSGYTWNTYTYGLPVWEAIPYDSANVLLVVGNGSLSDGIYKFNLTTNIYNLVQYCYIPTFIRYCIGNSTYYAGTRYNGMWSSADGITWTEIPYFQNKGCAAIDFYDQHIVVTQENNVFATYYSDNGGSTWNQSSSNIPIHDLVFDQTGVLYGVFTGISNSSGLYLSYDFGHTWTMENFIDNMNTVAFDATGSLLAGFHSATPTYEGVAFYDTTSNNYSFLNNGLPNLNINKIKINPVMSSITLFVCTDSAVYYSNDYFTSVQNNNFDENKLNVFPNPANDVLEIESAENTLIEIININGQIIEKIVSKDSMIKINISELSNGIYFVKIIPIAVGADNRFEIKKFIKK